MSGSAVEPDDAFDRRLEMRKPTYDKNVGQVPRLNLALRLKTFLTIGFAHFAE